MISVPGLGGLMARTGKSRVSKAVKQKVAKVKRKAVAVGTKVVAAAAKKAGKASGKIKALAASASIKKTKIAAAKEVPLEKKSVSQRLIETIEKRKLAKKDNAFGKIPGRRGRRPKNVEYTPNNNEEDSYVLESEHERLEYDTGIQLKEAGDDRAVKMERFEDFDEELNFDW